VIIKPKNSRMARRSGFLALGISEAGYSTKVFSACLTVRPDPAQHDNGLSKNESCSRGIDLRHTSFDRLGMNGRSVLRVPFFLSIDAHARQQDYQVNFPGSFNKYKMRMRS
jgi:hypothetical protein